MIIIFHIITILITNLLNKRKKIMHDPEENDIKFNPPLYLQRYGLVYDTLIDRRWRTDIKKLVDFGCAELQFFVYLKRLTCTNEIIFVDVDEDTLILNKSVVHPLPIEYVWQRTAPLQARVFAGSVADPDVNLKECDAVSAIELIEHLYPDTLDAFPYNIFYYIQPKIVIATTPNSDFNVLFKNFGKFRHYDHKFEWNREQFKDWANNIILRFPNYSLELTGLGTNPYKNQLNVGFCTQVAIFTRKDLLDSNFISTKTTNILCNCDLKAPCDMQCFCLCAQCTPDYSVGVCTYQTHSKQIQIDNSCTNEYYKLIEVIDYPFKVDGRSEIEKLHDDIKYKINMYGQRQSRFFEEDRNRAEIPLENLIYGRICSITVPELGEILKGLGYQIEECLLALTNETKLCVLYEPDGMAKSSSASSELSEDLYELDYQTSRNFEIEEDWDDEPIKEYCCLNDSIMTEESSNKKSTSQTNVNFPDADCDNKKQPESSALVDSGYQKSSIVDESPHSPSMEEFDLFEDATSSSTVLPNESASSPTKQHDLKKKLTLDVHRFNELDGPKFGPPVPPPINPQFFVSSPGILKTSPDSKQIPKEIGAGPSLLPRKRKKGKKLVGGRKTPSEEEESYWDDVRSIADCLVENTLNKIHVDEDEIDGVKHHKLIEEVNNDEIEVVEDEAVLIRDEPGVENGDLANNNRDMEGNNFVAPDERFVQQGDIANDNLEIDEGIVMNEDNNNDGVNVVNAAVNNELEMVHVHNNPEPPEQRQDPPNIPKEDDMEAVEQASREALFDPNSQVDLLEEFDIPSEQQNTLTSAVEVASNQPTGPPLPTVSSEDSNESGNYFIIGVQYLPDDADAANNSNAFPNWLLQILGTHMSFADNPETHDEPHFYCQGDGLGVHPSIAAVDIDEADDSTSSDTSSEVSAELPNSAIDSSMRSIPSLPPDTVASSATDAQSSGITSGELPLDVPTANSSSNNIDEEFFDTSTSAPHMPSNSTPSK